MSTISIIGTGDMAAAIGGLAAKAGHTVEVMGRDAARARALAEQVGAGATTGTFGAAPAGDMVILAVPYSAVLDVVKQYGEELAGKVLVDITNPVTSDHTSFVTPGDSFGAQEIAKAAPFRCESRQGVQHPVLPRSGCRSRRGPPIGRVHRRGRRAGEGTRLGVHREPGLRSMDTGPLPMARTLEHACLLSLGLLTHSVKHTNFSIGVSLLG